MKNAIILGVFTALATGMAIGVQSTLSSRLGGLIGPLRTGLFTNFIGGVVAGGFVLVAYIITRGDPIWALPRVAIIMLVASGTLGILIITGASFSFQRTGVTAGFAAILFGQLLIATVVDTMGWGGLNPIPLEIRRIGGLVVMATAIFLLLPRE